jgi:hypothetical protein
MKFLFKQWKKKRETFEMLKQMHGKDGMSGALLFFNCVN